MNVLICGDSSVTGIAFCHALFYNYCMAQPSNENALNAYVAMIAEAALIARKVVDALDDHMGVGPDCVTWAHVGNANKVLGDLRDMARFMGVKSDV